MIQDAIEQLYEERMRLEFLKHENELDIKRLTASINNQKRLSKEIKRIDYLIEEYSSRNDYNLLARLWQEDIDQYFDDLSYLKSLADKYPYEPDLIFNITKTCRIIEQQLNKMKGIQVDFSKQAEAYKRQFRNN